MQNHNIKCKEIIAIKKNFIEKLLIELMRNKREADANKVIGFCKDILQCLEEERENKIEGEYERNQHSIGMKEQFRGYIARD